MRSFHLAIVFIMAVQLAACAEENLPQTAADATSAADADPAERTEADEIAAAEALAQAEDEESNAEDELPHWQVPTEQIAEERIAAVLKQAKADMKSGNYIRQGEIEGALEGFLKVLALVPDQPEALSGRDEVLGRLADRVLPELTNGRFSAANQLEQIFRNVNPDHPQMVVLSANLEAAREARDAKRSGDAQARKRRRFAIKGDSAQKQYAKALQVFPGYMPAQKALDRILASELKLIAQSIERERFTDAQTRLSALSQVVSDSEQVGRLQVLLDAQRTVSADRALAQAAEDIDRLDLAAAEKQIAQAQKFAPGYDAVARTAQLLESVRRYGHFLPGQVFTEPLRIGTSGPELVVVPFGSFEIGSDRDSPGHEAHEAPKHRVKFERGFAITRTEVTMGMYRQFVEATQYQTLAERKGRSTVYDEKGGAMTEHRNVDWRRDYAGKRSKNDQLPVVHVAFEDAMAFAVWLSEQTGQRYRLPTEAEYEYVLRGGTTTVYPWGNQSPKRLVGNLTGSGDRSPQGRNWGAPIPNYKDGHWGPAPVASFPQEHFNTFDLTGNVSEWVLDCWHDSYQRAPGDGTAWVNPGCSHRVVRGGSWASSLDQARSAYRLSVEEQTVNARVGFRLVREL